MTTDLVPHWQIGSVALTSYPFGVDADSTVDIGEPSMVVEGITSGLADGDLERVVRHGNRTYVLEIYIEGPTLGELAKSEALLRSELGRTGLLLTHEPGDGFAPASAYEVQTAQLTPQRRDDHESHLIRKYTLTLTCSPWARSAEPTVVPPLVNYPGGSVVVDECNASTGWTAFRNGTPATVVVEDAAAVKASSTDPNKDMWTIMRTGVVDFSTNRYLVGEVRTSTGDVGAEGYLSLTGYLSTGGASVPMTTVSVRRLTDNPNYFQVIWDTGGVTAQTLSFAHTRPGAVWIRRLTAQPSASVSLSRQQTRIVTPEGTERTPVSIHVQANNGTDNLGMAIVHTCPDTGSGYSPPLRRWRVSGNAVSTATDTLSGESEPLNATAFVADVPSDSLPAGGYVLMARIKASEVTGSSVTVNIGWQVSSWFLPTSNSQGIVSGTAEFTFDNSGFYQLVPMAVLTLPTVRGAGMTQVAINYTGAFTGTLTLDEAWLFRADDECALTIVTDELPHLWLDSADVNSPVPTVWRGTSNDRHTARHPGTALQAMGAHVLSAGGTSVFTAAVTDIPKTDFTYYDRWHSNAAR